MEFREPSAYSAVPTTRFNFKSIDQNELLIYISLQAYLFSTFGSLPPPLVNLFFLILIITILACKKVQTKELKFYKTFFQLSISIFVVLALTNIQSRPDFFNYIEGIWEYRIFIIIPLFIHKIKDLDFKIPIKWWFVGPIAGGFFSILFSYLLAYQIIYIDDRYKSLANNIFHGFSIALFLSVIIFYHARVFSVLKNSSHLIFIFSYIIIFCNIFFIEQGRTAYLQVAVVALAALVFLVEGRLKILGIFGFLLLLVISYLVSEGFVNSVNRAVFGIMSALSDEDYSSSAGIRIGFYRAVWSLGPGEYYLGFGASAVSDVLSVATDVGILDVYTDNPHSEFATMYLMGGPVLLTLFCLWIFCILDVAHWKFFSGADKFLLVSLFLVVVVGCLANSVLKDFGEKQLLIGYLTLVFCAKKIKIS